MDLLIKNGLVIDGTGAAAKRADVAVSGGKITEVGNISGKAKRTIDADGLAVAPSSWHGVTSVVMGNCGVGIAPCRPQTREIAMRDLVNVEAIPFEVLQA